MPIDMAPPSSNIQGYQIAPPQSVDPLQTLAQMGQLRQQAVQTQNAQMQMQSARGLMAAYHDAGGDIDKMVQIAPQYGVMPDELMKVQTALEDMKNKRAQTALYGSEADKNAQAALDAKHDAMNAHYQDIYDIKDPNEQYAALQSRNQALINQGWDPKDLLQATGPGDVAQVVANGKHAYTTSNWLKDQATQDLQKAQTGESTAKAGQAQAEEEMTRTNQQLAQHKIELYDLLTANPQALAQKVAKSIDPQKYPNLYQRALNDAQGQPDIDGINKAIQNYANIASEQEKSISTETNPDVINAQVGKAVATAKATAPIDVQKQIDAEIGKAQQAPGAFTSVIEPEARRRAETDYGASSKTYLDKLASVQQFKDFIAAARSGNVNAPGFLPLAELKEMINTRVNRNELEAVGPGQGNLKDQVLGAIGKMTRGQIFDARVLNDMDRMANVMAMGAKRTYDASLELNRSTYNSKVQPVDISKIYPRLAGGTGGSGGAAPTGKIPPPPGTTRQFKDGTTRSFSGKLPASDINNWTVVKVK